MINKRSWGVISRLFSCIQINRIKRTCKSNDVRVHLIRKKLIILFVNSHSSYSQRFQKMDSAFLKSFTYFMKTQSTTPLELY